MDQSDERELYRRISQLENAVSEIKEILEQFVPHVAESVRPPEPPPPPEPTPASPPPPPPPTAPVAPTPAPPSPMPPQTPTPAPRPVSSAPARRPTFQMPDMMRQSEFWLKIVGIGLLLFGVAFAFKYSIEQGWINPLVRHLFGLAVGGILLFLGLRLYDKRRPFAQVLLGGSIGTFYITCFSAFQLFELISHTVAFACMIAITAAAFYIAIRQDDAIFSLIGTAGALGTPFLLYTGSGNLPGLVLYTCLVLAGTAAVYFFKGWRLLLWLSVIGGWIVLSIGIEGGDLARSGGSDTDHWAMQAGILFAWLLFWLTPLLRRVACVKPNARWRADRLGIGDNSLTADARKVMDRHVHLFAISSPLIAHILSVQTWPSMANTVIGWGAMGATMLYWLTAVYLKRTESLRGLAFTHTAVGALLMTISFCLLLYNNVLLFTLAGEAVLFHLLARRLNDSKITVGGHILFIFVGLWALMWLAFDNAGTPAFFNDQALVELWTIACAVATAFIVGRPVSRRVYLIVAAISLGLLFHREFSGDLLFFLLTLETAGFFLLARTLKDDTLDALSHVAWGCMAIYLATRLSDARTAELAFFNLEALINLLPIGLAVGASFWLTDTGEKYLYRLVVHLGVLAWLARELLPLDNGQGFVSAAWGVYGIGMLIAGLRMNISRLRLVGLGTMMLVVAKLFLVDLARLETIWRVLLFIGFGAIFLTLSYYFPKLWKGEVGESDSSEESARPNR